MSIVVETAGLLTVEEYESVAPDDCPSELVRGRIVRMNRPHTAHGYWVSQIQDLIKPFVRQHQLGRVTCGDAGVVTERNPDTLRGADVAFYSYARVPEGTLPKGYWPAPDLAVEVKSPTDRWPMIHQKIAEYLAAGVTNVIVMDPETRSLQVYSAERPIQVLGEHDTLTLPDVLPGFAVPLREVFE
jgi:Uma2 family endonuclease